MDVDCLLDNNEAFENVNFGFLHRNVPKTTKTVSSSINAANMNEMKMMRKSSQKATRNQQPPSLASHQSAHDSIRELMSQSPKACSPTD